MSIIVSSRTLPPGPKGLPLVGSVREVRANPLEFFSNTARQYGDIAYLRLGPQQIFLLSNPDYIRDVLVTNNRNFMKSRGLQLAKRLLGEGMLTSDGEFHTRQRRLAQPAFHHERIAGYASVVVEYAQRMRERMKDGDRVSIGEEMMRLTLGIVAKTLFDADVEGESAEIGQALSVSISMFNRVTNPFAEFLNKLPLPSNRRFDRAKGRLDDTIYRIIREHRASGDRGDLLSMLLAAQDTEGDGTGMTDLQLRDEAMTIFLAGHETTANALMWAWYLLSQHPQVEERLHREVDTVLQGRPAVFADVERLEYTRKIVNETMRMYPPAWIIGRKALADHRVGEYVLPAGWIALMSQWVMHHDPRYYPDPYKFDPERWNEAEAAVRPKFAYFPFGGGPRVCIGEQFARMESILVLATLAQRLRFTSLSSTPPVPAPMITLRSRQPIFMMVNARSV